MSRDSITSDRQSNALSQSLALENVTDNTDISTNILSFLTPVEAKKIMVKVQPFFEGGVTLSRNPASKLCAVKLQQLISRSRSIENTLTLLQEANPETAKNIASLNLSDRMVKREDLAKLKEIFSRAYPALKEVYLDNANGPKEQHFWRKEDKTLKPAKRIREDQSSLNKFMRLTKIIAPLLAISFGEIKRTERYKRKFLNSEKNLKNKMAQPQDNKSFSDQKLSFKPMSESLQCITSSTHIDSLMLTGEE